MSPQPHELLASIHGVGLDATFTAAFLLCPDPVDAAADKLTGLGMSNVAALITDVHKATLYHDSPEDALLEGQQFTDWLMSSIRGHEPVLIAFLQELPIYHFLEVCKANRYMHALATRDGATLCANIAAKASAQIPRLSSVFFEDSASNMNGLDKIKRHFAAAVIFGGFGVSAMNPTGDSLRLVGARGLEILSPITSKINQIVQTVGSQSFYSAYVLAGVSDTMKLYAEDQLHHTVMNCIETLPASDQQHVRELLRMLTTGLCPLFRVVSTPSTFPHRAEAYRPDFWRLWFVFNDFQALLRACEGGVLSGGSFLRDVEDTWMPQGLKDDLRTDLLLDFEAWYKQDEYYGRDQVNRALNSLHKYKMYYTDVATNVTRW